MFEVPGSGDPAARARALALIETIADPCSTNFSRPTGLVSMGIIDRLDLSPDGEADLWIMPTIPGCLFLGVIEEKVEAALAQFDWCLRVRCHCAAGLWDPSRMQPVAEPVEDA